MNSIEAQKFIEKKDFGKALDIFLEIEKKNPVIFIIFYKIFFKITPTTV